MCCCIGEHLSNCCCVGGGCHVALSTDRGCSWRQRLHAHMADPHRGMGRRRFPAGALCHRDGRGSVAPHRLLSPSVQVPRGLFPSHRKPLCCAFVSMITRNAYCFMFFVNVKFLCFMILHCFSTYVFDASGIDLVNRDLGHWLIVSWTLKLSVPKVRKIGKGRWFLMWACIEVAGLLGEQLDYWRSNAAYSDVKWRQELKMQRQFVIVRLML